MKTTDIQRDVNPTTPVVLVLACYFLVFLAAGCGKPESKSVVKPKSDNAVRSESDDVLKLAPRLYAERMISGIPDIRAAESGVQVSRDLLFKKDYTFTDDYFTQCPRVWDVVMAPYKGKPGLQYVEVGTFEGASVLWMLENVLTDPSCRAKVIDPFYWGNYEEKYRANIEKSGFKEKVTTIVGWSQIELRRIPVESCDIIYIDGGHTPEDVLEDAVLSWRLVKKGGLLVVDDYQWHGEQLKVEKRELSENIPVAGINAFYAFFGKHFDVIHNGYQVILKRK
jgi:predicted O-methyltransferase YrrM